MSGMYTKAEISKLKGNVTRLEHKSVITRGEAAQLRDLIINNPTKAKYQINQKLIQSKH